MLVTGAGAGVGLACARAFADRDIDLLLSDIDGPERAASALNATGLMCDVSSEASVALFASDVERSFPSIDVLVNAAGHSYVRTLGTLRVSRALLPMMMKDGGPKDIVNIADMNVDADNGPFPYAASLNAFVCLAEAMAENMRSSNVVLTTVLPPSEKARSVVAADPFLSSASWHRRLYCDPRDIAALAQDILASLARSATDRHGTLASPTPGDRSSRRG